jgi:hypothetical protein
MKRGRIHRPPLCWLGILSLLGATAVAAYPLDGYRETGIARLEAYDLAAKAGQEFLPRGARYPSSVVGLGLAERPDFTLPAPDAEFSREIVALIPSDAADYALAVLDITDPDKPRYAEHNVATQLNPGSVGKIVVALALFQALADAYPTDIAARRAILKDTMVTADDFINYDSHDVPVWHPGDPKLVKQPIAIGDTANLWTFLDWMSSASSNAAAAIVQRETMLIRKFGAAYPVSAERASAYFAETPKQTLRVDLSAAMQSPVTRNGLDIANLRQGSFFTDTGKRHVPGYTSYASSRELMRFLVLMEQGKLVDRFSSLEIKKLLYLTDTRIRYAAAPALDGAAVYFKSGSLYSCQPEPGFTCERYHGNVQNHLSSVAVVETPDRAVRLRYLVVINSNVLRKNASVAHQTFATRLHRLMETAHPAASATR